MIYLDYSANTPLDPRVLEVYCRTEQNFIGNPNSTHAPGRPPTGDEPCDRPDCGTAGGAAGGNHLYIRRNGSQ